ncbi:MAG: ester cyclase [Pseudomonadota bacterium]
MRTVQHFIAAVAVILTIGAHVDRAHADDKALVQTFYDFLSNPTSKELSAQMRTVLADDWKSVGDYSGKAKEREKFIKQINGFGGLIPDMKWVAEEMLQAGNRVIVRGRASGTPQGPLFGVDGGGKGFEIMTIDIHTVEDGQIVRTYHVEDWAGALRQLSQ